MMIAAPIQQASLTDASPSGAIAGAASWITDLLFGPLATTIAIIAIAWIGFSMLQGRIDIRRGASVVFGCFLLFGARGIAEGLRSSAMSEGMPIAASVPPPPMFTQQPGAASNANAFDPYAGAAVIRPRE